MSLKEPWISHVEHRAGNGAEGAVGWGDPQRPCSPSPLGFCSRARRSRWASARGIFPRLWLLAPCLPLTALLVCFVMSCHLWNFIGDRLFFFYEYLAAMIVFHILNWDAEQNPRNPNRCGKLKGGSCKCKLRWGRGENEDTLNQTRARTREDLESRKGVLCGSVPTVPGWHRCSSLRPMLGLRAG